MMKFTIIIPTRERADTLRSTLQTCLLQDYDNFEILVSDNCSGDNTRQVAESFANNKIRYICTPGRLSMSHNWEFALNHVESGYVTILGDDDGLLPNALKDIAQLLQNNKVSSMCWRVASFTWPSVSDLNEQGIMELPLYNYYRIFDSEALLKNLSSDVYKSVLLPSLYWGVCDIEVLRKATYNKRLFYSFQPDVYIGAVIACHTKKFLYSYRPFSVSGASHHSSGKAFIANKLDQSSNEKFFSESNIPVHARISIARCNALLLAEPLLQVADIYRQMPAIDMKKNINSALWEAQNCHREDVYNAIVKTLKEVAQKNKLDSYLERLLRKTPAYQKTEESVMQTFGYLEKSRKLRINTKLFQINGKALLTTLEASEFAYTLLGSSQPARLSEKEIPDISW